MCSFFRQWMENDQGDLADIVRASGSGGASTNNPTVDWQFSSEPMNFHPGIDESIEDFVDPFSNMRDPLLHELNLPDSVFYNHSTPTGLVAKMKMEEGGAVGNFIGQKMLGQEMKMPSNIFSRILQISPNSKMAFSECGTSPSTAKSPASPGGVKNLALNTNDMIKAKSSVGCSVESGGVQISSPRTPGIKRRKSQAKKVVCIPAPAAANSRPSGEVVPSDLWAWRKYGQKPIKGSPYPRGYYRCSSSKGCSARKQVERSRTDPNMLVITYTSEHNHPWPTQRNALAGSTRSQPTKPSKTSPSNATRKPTNTKEEHQLDDLMTPTIKEESTAEIENPVDEMDEGEFNQSLLQSYRQVAVPDVINHSDDFFADLGELEPDPLNLIFSQGFPGDEKSEGGRENSKGALDPFSLFNWSGDSFGEARRGL